MAQLLHSLKGNSDILPLQAVQRIWSSKYKKDEQAKTRATAPSANIPSIIEKIIKLKPGSASFSINEIVSLGNQLEHNHTTQTTVQNWVKRDIRDLIGPPAHTKKYSVDQAALIFVIEDLRTIMGDLSSVQKMLSIVFSNPGGLREDWIRPVEFYAAYSSIFEDLDPDDDQMLDIEEGSKLDIKGAVEKKADQFAETLGHLSAEEKETLSDILVVATLSVQTSYFQSLARQTANSLILSRVD